MKEDFFMTKLRNLLKESVQTFTTVGYLATLGILGALAIALNYVASFDFGPYVRIGFSGLPNRITEFLFGPFVGAIFGALMDVLKFFLKPTGTFFPGFTLNAALGGIIYGALLYKKPLKLWRVAVAEFLVKLFINCGLNTYWLSILYGKAFTVLLPARALKNLIMLPIDTLILFIFLTGITKVLKTMKSSRHFLYPFEKNTTKES